MAILKNLPTAKAQKLESLIEGVPHQVISMGLAQSDQIHMSLFAFAEGEMVSEEQYPGDTLYFVVAGETLIEQGERKDRLHQGDVLMVPGNTLHAVGGAKAFSMLQITLAP